MFTKSALDWCFSLNLSPCFLEVLASGTWYREPFHKTITTIRSHNQHKLRCLAGGNHKRWSNCGKFGKQFDHNPKFIHVDIDERCMCFIFHSGCPAVARGGELNILWGQQLRFCVQNWSKNSFSFGQNPSARFGHGVLTWTASLYRSDSNLACGSTLWLHLEDDRFIRVLGSKLRVLLRFTRWWFQFFFYVHPYLGKISNLTIIFFRWVETTN